jgi:hypothetical protein
LKSVAYAEILISIGEVQPCRSAPLAATNANAPADDVIEEMSVAVKFSIAPMMDWTESLLKSNS